MKLEQKNRAKELRKKGYSLNEISKDVGVSKSSASNWLKDIILDGTAKKRLSERVASGQLKSAIIKREKTKRLLDNFQDEADKLVENIDIDRDLKKIICSLLYWCEGGKSDHRVVQFTNSDPALIRTFLYLMRESFEIDESKFRGCIHLHDYHDSEIQHVFWAEVTGFDRSQFFKPFQKRNTGKRIRDGYQGCIMIKYYDANVIRELLSISRSFMKKHRGVR